ncbi:MAG: hypothetical protein WC565_05245 [Parcubacteria group bacterium]|jgi:hypothetical protein
MPRTQWQHLQENLLEPVTLKAIDVRPYAYALWCCIEDGVPFANDIVCRRWSDDGKHIWWMLDTHNFAKYEPDELVEVIELENPWLPSDFEAEHEAFLAKRPP